jgi:hypothetical protein
MNWLERAQANAAAANAGEGKPIFEYHTRGVVTAVSTGFCTVELFGDEVPDIPVLQHASSVAVDDEVSVRVMGN